MMDNIEVVEKRLIVSVEKIDTIGLKEDYRREERDVRPLL